MRATGVTCHATCLVLGEQGLLIRGPSGAGKSTLCLTLLDEAERDGRHAALVADDRVRMSVRGDRLIGACHPATAGLIEIRGHGLLHFARTLGATVIRLVVELVEEQERLPAAEPDRTEVLGLTLPALHLARCQPREYLIRTALATLRRDSVS